MIQPTATHRSEKFLAVLASLGRLLATGSGQRQMLADVLKELDRELGMIRGTLMLVSQDGSELFIEAAPNVPSPWDPGLRYRRGEGIIGTVVQTGKSAIIPRVSEEPRFTNRIHRRLTDESGEVGFLCVPIPLGNEVVGTLSVDLPVRIAEPARSGAVLGDRRQHDRLRREARRMEAMQRQTVGGGEPAPAERLKEQFRPENIIGNSHAMREVYLRIDQVAASDTTVLIRGESGTGKELVASAIHYSSRRGARPFVKVNCAALERRAAGERAVRPREGRLHRRPVHARIGRLRGGRRRHAVPGRDRRFLARPSRSSCCACCRSASSSGWAAIETLKVDVRDHRRHQPRPGGPRRGRPVPPGPVLPHQRLSHRPAAAARAQGRHPAAGRPLRGEVRQQDGQGGAPHQHPGHQHDDGLPLAGQRPRAGELHRVCRAALQRRRDPRPQPAADAADAGAWNGCGRIAADRVELLEKDMIVDALKTTGGSMTTAAEQLGITARMVRYKIKNLRIDYQQFFKKNNSRSAKQ